MPNLLMDDGSVLCPYLKRMISASTSVRDTCHGCPHFGGYKNATEIECNPIPKKFAADIARDTYERGLHAPDDLEELLEENLDDLIPRRIEDESK